MINYLNLLNLIIKTTFGISHLIKLNFNVFEKFKTFWIFFLFFKFSL